ncbi:MAG: hypothetical protein ACUVXF_07650 [Desulfobaccales bacterium]
MKITTDIAATLLEKARQPAACGGKMIKPLLEEGLGKVLPECQRAVGGFQLKKASCKGQGLQPKSRRRLLGAPAGVGLRGAGRMIAVDTNILVYAHREDSPWQGQAEAGVMAVCRLPQVRELWTAGRDFSRFPGLKVKAPLLS